MTAASQCDSVVRAYGGAVEAYYASLKVDGVRSGVDAFAFATTDAKSATDAFVGVDVDM